ncbi:chromosome segregation protein SMC [Caryophanon latum]|uniref:Chromosome partition protein Smc n=1 Tax=Caryophanon latum TaxID=33977 RepID=A0A1C0YWG9_9BACL|nr:chromosome segregation protein SMC [Caryophanon latum]OCS91473.1 chromosome segregation protein SMC [Caryophanon latum]
MFLKRLEVVGFKSFAERIGIDFVPGVTAVVGPNGSGKSNVIDAVRWVLGEQSAKSLRGAKMEDVIFAGSDSRKALNFAEVTLVLDNTDERLQYPYTEVSVTRRVYRSGDSEYLLNKQSCRLKDITDLFMDSGLGKEAFSIISQGRVDEILNSRAQDRRSIFEEAAGVLKYKLRKKKAEHKLVETDENLNRVLDILHELDRRLEPLHMQASAAQDYLQMTEEMRDYDIALLVHNLQMYTQELQNSAVELSRLQQQEQQYVAQIATEQQHVQQLRQQLTALDGKLDAAQNDLIEASTEVERSEGRRALYTQQSENREQQREKLTAALAEATADVEQLQQRKDELQQSYAAKKEDVEQLKAEVKKLEQLLTSSASEIAAHIEEQKSLYIERLNEQATVKNELKHIHQQLEQQHEMNSRVTTQTSQMHEELAQLAQQEAALQKQVNDDDEALRMQIAQYSELQAAFNALVQKLEQKEALLYDAYRMEQQQTARKESLEALEADFSGFYQGVKEVLVARDKQALRGIEGAVAELIQVPTEYTKAIETALGAAAQHIVTTDEQAAQQAIAYLKQKRAGRATFLPKTVMRSRKLQRAAIAHVLEHPAFIACADELLTASGDNQSIIENLLGNVIVAKHLEGATAIARGCQYKYRVVTLDGDIVNAGGSLTGGAAKVQNSVFSRRAELDELTASLQQMSAKMTKAEQSIAADKASVAEQRNALDAAKIRSEEMRAVQLERAAKLREIQSLHRQLKTRLSLTTSENSDLQTRRESLLVAKEQAEMRAVQLEQELQQLNAAIEQMTTAKEQNDEEKDVVREQFATKRAQLAVAEEQRTQTQVATADVEVTLMKAQERIASVTQELEWLQNDEAQEDVSLDELTAQVERWLQTRQQLTDALAALKEQRLQQQQSLTDVEAALQQSEATHKQVVEQLHQLDMQRNRTELLRNRENEQLEEQYELTLEQAIEQVREIDDLDYARRKVKLLKQSIEELGPVNVSAIEEFREVSARHAFLTEQRNDLIEAQNTLHDAIREMDEEMTQRFKTTFESIRSHFKLVFRELFGGGQADLVLTDADNLLETGIEIVAQPPGKKLQNLSLLSGGERALTAIGLLFAILKTRPVPFCILDEVEAALDDSNVVRYSQYLKKFSEHTQFIVITHRKGTMEGADVLYGITMQESGVSKLVSVKLEEDAPVTMQ